MVKSGKILSRQLLAVFCVLAALGSASVAQAAVKQQLSGSARVFTKNGELDSLATRGNFSSASSSRTGRHIQSWKRNTDRQAISADIARFSVQLAGKEFRGNRKRGKFEFAGSNPGGSPFNPAIPSGAAAGLNSLGVTLGNKVISRDGMNDGGEDFNMPNLGQPLVAELHYDGNSGLTFESWYKNPSTNVWLDVASGDTSSQVGTPPAQIPEPTTILLMSLALVALFFGRLDRLKSLATIPA